MNRNIELTLCTIQDASSDTMVCFEDGIRSLRRKTNERINDLITAWTLSRKIPVEESIGTSVKSNDCPWFLQWIPAPEVYF